MINLIIVFAYIAITTIGGGYAMIPLIQNEAINIHHWITETDFINILAISQITPGAIAINSATYVGFKSYGILGSIIAPVGFVLPSFLLVFFLAPLLKKYETNPIRVSVFDYIRPVVTGLIATAIITLSKTVYIQTGSISYLGIGLTIIAFGVLRYFKLRPVFILLGCGLLGILLKL